MATAPVVSGGQSVWCSTRGPDNTRLHLTAPRAHRSDAARGEREPDPGQRAGPGRGARAGWLVGVHHGLSGRAAPQVSRNR